VLAAVAVCLGFAPGAALARFERRMPTTKAIRSRPTRQYEN
jgi:hypothetical protein